MNKFRASFVTSLVIAAVALMFALSGCSRGTVNAKVNEVKVVEAPDPNLVTMDHPELFPTVAVELRKIPNELPVNGVIAPDVSRTVPVNALSGGRVVEIKAQLGDYVAKGQVLLALTSPDLSSAISDYRKAVADEALSKRQLERSQLLYENGALAQKDLQIAEDTEEKARVDLQTTAEHIRILGGTLSDLSPIIEIRAPVSGTIVEQNVTNAAGVKSPDNSPNLYTIADLSRVWMLCDVYENNLSQVHLGDHAAVTLNAYPNRKIDGRISNISSLLDPTTRTAKVRIDLPNPGGLMKPNMFGTVLFVSQSDKTRMAVPESAILRLQDRDWVFVKLNAKQFRRTEVQGLPAGQDGYQEILAGVQPGAQLAANALQFSRAVENQAEQTSN
ncbi:MAG: efflux RND transporter periplasmic adaptor subunit [Bryobacteraceae bacterium]